MLTSAILTTTPIDASADELDVVAADLAIDLLTWHWPRHPMQRSPSERRRMAEYLASSAERWNVPVSLLVSMAWFETTFQFDLKGRSHGEVGVLQVHGRAKRGCNLDTQSGRLDCGARWLASGRAQCGSMTGALVRYGTGECETRDDHVRVYVRRRLRLAKRLERLDEFGKLLEHVAQNQRWRFGHTREAGKDRGDAPVIGYTRRGIAGVRRQNFDAFSAVQGPQL